MEKAKKPFQDAHKSRSKSQRKSTYSRRLSANQKERRRTQNINSAFAELRRCIPNVPQDTKLSKIRTLRLATSYIGYLQEVLQEEQDRETKAETRSLSKPTRTVSLNSSRKYKPTIVSVKVRYIKDRSDEQKCLLYSLRSKYAQPPRCLRFTAKSDNNATMLCGMAEIVRFGQPVLVSERG